MARLKPCPFCGNKAEVKKWRERLYSIYCTGKYCIVETGNSVSIESAAKIWNRRRPPFKEYYTSTKIKPKTNNISQ